MASGFHEVAFPVALSLGTTGGPERRTDIVALSNGRESRNARWHNARRRYDAGLGIRRADDLYKLVAFFEARQGSLYGFRFKDPIDHSSNGFGDNITANDQLIGTGDAATKQFSLLKNYSDIGGQTTRLIEKPVIGSVLIAVDGAALTSGFNVDHTKGLVTFNSAPANGASITAGFLFDVPVRFDLDRLDINLSSFNAGHVPSVPLVEIRPDH